jgi:CheY-like chemotaxis protein
MDAATLARAIEPFFSTKGIGKGTGLGLSMVHGLTSQLGGGLRIDSRVGLGTTVEMLLPVAETSIAAPAITTADVVGPRASGRVLLVDDEDVVRVATADMLVELGYQVTEAESGQAALDIMGQQDFDLLVSDHMMPGMAGTDLARIAVAQCPALRVLIISGYAEVESVAPDLARLTKPFRTADLGEAITALGGDRPD